MRDLLNWLLVSFVNGMLRAFRLPGLNRADIYSTLGHPRLQPVLEWIGARKAYDIYRRALKQCPAYRAFLIDHNATRLAGLREFHHLPETTKANYVTVHSIEDRCYYGRIPMRGVVIDESSGSSGTPNNWVRGTAERNSVKRLLQHGFALTFHGQPQFVLNCFALGPWATGMNLSMALIDVAILKSIGPDKQKLESTLRTFGTRYRYLIAGYPPFMKDFLDTTTLELPPYELHLVVGGEGISEGLRDHFLRIFRTVHSSYGASDLEINIAAETEFSIALRRLAMARPLMCRELFGRDDPPMVFQYNPLDYHVERSVDGELVFSILRRGNAAPKIRYNIHDQGGTILHRRLPGILARHGLTLDQLPTPHSGFPILFVYGRSDLTVPFYGAKIFATDIDAILNGDPGLRRTFHSFQMSSGHDANLDETLTIVLELAAHNQSPFDTQHLRSLFYEGLKRVNQDFREVSKMFTSERMDIQQCLHGTGPFAHRDIRVKNRYISTP